MSLLRIAAVQASILMDRDATIDRVEELTAECSPAGGAARGVPRGLRSRNADLDRHAADLGRRRRVVRHARGQRGVIPGPAVDRLATIAEKHGVWLVVGVQEREPTGSTIYNTVLYFAPDGRLVDRHRKLVPTGSERTVWGMGDGSTLRVVDTQHGRIGGLICWENYMPLARFHLYAQGVDVWLAPTLAQGDGWVATMQHLARENRMYVVGVNPVLHVDQHPRRLPRPRAARPCRLRRRARSLDRAGEHRDRRARAARSLPDPCASARRRSSPNWTCRRSRQLAASWTQPAITTDPTSSGCWSTRPAGTPPSPPPPPLTRPTLTSVPDVPARRSSLAPVAAPP